MADGYIQVAPDSTGKKVDNESLTVGANTVLRQRVQVAGAADVEIARVMNSDPFSTTYGLATRTYLAGLYTPAARARASMPVESVQRVVRLRQTVSPSAANFQQSFSLGTSLLDTNDLLSAKAMRVRIQNGTTQHIRSVALVFATTTDTESQPVYNLTPGASLNGSPSVNAPEVPSGGGVQVWVVPLDHGLSDGPIWLDLGFTTAPTAGATVAITIDFLPNVPENANYAGQKPVPVNWATSAGETQSVNTYGRRVTWHMNGQAALAMTLVAEVSLAAGGGKSTGTTGYQDKADGEWVATSFRPLGGGPVVSSLVNEVGAGAQTERGWEIVTWPGVRAARVRVSAWTSGALTGTHFRTLPDVPEDLLTGRASSPFVLPTGVADGAPVAAWLDRRGRVITGQQQLPTYHVGGRLATVAATMVKTVTLTANTHRQIGVLWHAATAVKRVEVRRVLVWVHSLTVAGDLWLEVQRLNATTTPATGNPAITPAAWDSGDGAAEAIFLMDPTTAGTLAAQDAPLAGPISAKYGAQATPGTLAPPPAPTAFLLYERDDSNTQKRMFLRPGIAEGIAIIARSPATSPVLGYTLEVDFTEETPA